MINYLFDNLRFKKINTLILITTTKNLFFTVGILTKNKNLALCPTYLGTVQGLKFGIYL